VVLSTTLTAPRFKTLSRDECESVLLRNSVGRIAYAVHDRVSIVPIHYVFVNGWIYARTASAGKLRQILRNRRIAFEVDEHTDLFDWKSVVVHGPLYVVQPDSTQLARSVYRTAVSVLRKLVPETLSDVDPVPFRDQLIRIRAVDISGRAAESIGGQRLFPGNGDVISETAEPGADAKLRAEVESAIARIGVPESSDIHVEVFDGVVALSGTVETIRDRQAIEVEILKAPAAIAIVQEIETTLPVRQDPLPTELARVAVTELRSGADVSSDGLKVVVEHGWLRLEGAAKSYRHRDDALRRLRAIKGARGVIDRSHVAG
jgi:nitroimidazol reductase NimA-like FMN-containing flavoprotein (pyridoxamine 5'-phosphate oxidase superfamily)/osmotically-inducible protein OsmY